MKNKVTGKFDVSEKDELILLKHWIKDYSNNLLKIPDNLKGKITEQQATNLFAYYQDLGNDTGNRVNIKVIENRINELENKFQKQKEQNFFYLIKKHLKELSAKKIAELIIAFVLGFLLGNFF